MQKFKAYRTFQENDAVVEPLRRDDDRTSSIPATSSSGPSTRRSTTRTRCRTTAPARSCASTRPTPASTWRAPSSRRATRAGSAATRSSCTRYDMGVAHDGGYSEYVRVPGGLGRAAAREHDGVRRDDARHGGLHRGAGDHADGAQRAQARQRPGGRDRRDRRRGLGGGRDPGQDRLSRRRDHRQAGGSRATCRALGAKEVLQRQAHRPREDPPARQVDVGRAPSTTWAATCSRGCCRR